MGDKTDLYFGNCSRCSKAVCGVDGACQAMGQLFHSKCFTCFTCRRIYCEDDFLYSGVHPAPEVCACCGHLIEDDVFQARGQSYHTSCFRCVVCRQSLEGLPFTVDNDNKVYCVSDYHKLKAPRCAMCKMPILPTEGSTDCIRVVSFNRSFHVECFGREVNLI